jgi:hypothetical protein
MYPIIRREKRSSLPTREIEPVSRSVSPALPYSTGLVQPAKIEPEYQAKTRTYSGLYFRQTPLVLLPGYSRVVRLIWKGDSKMTRTSWVEMCVSDFEQSIVWFEQVLGFRVVARDGNDYAELSRGETFI